MTSTNTLRILIADDSAVIRGHLLALLAPLPFAEVVADVADAENAIRTARERTPDVILLDIAMPGGGINVLKVIKRESPETIVVMLTNHAGPFYERVSRRLGADFFLDKSNAFERVPEVLKTITSV